MCWFYIFMDNYQIIIYVCALGTVEKQRLPLARFADDVASYSSTHLTALSYNCTILSD